ncbi:MAG: sensor histidine kinase, partial [Bryobacteraceae bacterium]
MTQDADQLRQELAITRAELTLARAQLTEASRMAAVGGLLASIVHEINTPIGSILSNNETLHRSVDSVKKAIQDTPGMTKPLSLLDMMAGLTAVDKIACERISAVIRGLKTFSRVDDSKPREVDLHENLNNTLKLVGCEFRRRVSVDTDFGAIPKVECYPQMLNQVFLNILVNASQAIEGEGKVTVRT